MHHVSPVTSEGESNPLQSADASNITIGAYVGDTEISLRKAY
jgi:hypothetical protein